jgi:phosphoenolpyruvate-protein kinase (PTS system EI component)
MSCQPEHGLRGIRLSLHIKDAFRIQIEAILRAARDGRIEMVLPMISTIEEIWQTKALIAEVRSSLRETAGLELPPVPLGIMIEVPAAVLTLETLAQKRSFSVSHQ